MDTSSESPLAAFFGDFLKDKTAIVEVDNHRMHQKEVVEPVDKTRGILRWESDINLCLNLNDESSVESDEEESLEELASRWTSDQIEGSFEDDKESEEIRRRRTSLTKPQRTCSNEHMNHPQIAEELSKMVAARNSRQSRRTRNSMPKKPAPPSTSSPQMPIRKSSITADTARMIEQKYNKKSIVAHAC